MIALCLALVGLATLILITSVVTLVEQNKRLANARIV